MKKNILLYLFIFFIILASVSSETCAFAQEDPSSETARQAALMANEIVASRAEAAAQWKSSLGNIEETSAVLVETNTKLSQEYQLLMDQTKAAEAAVLAQKQKNAELFAALEKRKAEIGVPVSQAAEKTQAAEQERQLVKKRADLSAAQTRLRGLEGAIRLRQLKLSELDIEKKTAQLERQLAEGAALNAVRAETASLARELESLTEQEKIIHGKLATLRASEPPFVGESRAVADEIAALKQKLTEVSDQETALLNQADEMQSKTAAVESDKAVAQYKKLVSEKQAVEMQIAEARKDLEEMTRARAKGPQEIEALKRKLDSLEAQNKAVSAEVDDLRENIVVLDYKISSMGRYQTRNRDKGR